MTNWIRLYRNMPRRFFQATETWLIDSKYDTYLGRMGLDTPVSEKQFVHIIKMLNKQHPAGVERVR